MCECDCESVCLHYEAVLSWELGMFQKPGIYSAQSYFSGCNVCFTIDRQKLPCVFIASTTSSEQFLQNFCHESTSCNFHTFCNTNASTATRLYTKTQAETLQKRQNDEKPWKDQSLYIISAINTVVHLARFLFFFPCWLVLISPVLCVNCATCCAGPC